MLLIRSFPIHQSLLIRSHDLLPFLICSIERECEGAVAEHGAERVQTGAETGQVEVPGCQVSTPEL